MNNSIGESRPITSASRALEGESVTTPAMPGPGPERDLESACLLAKDHIALLSDVNKTSP